MLDESSTHATAVRTVAVSGSTGLIGSAIAAGLRSEGRTVKPIVRRRPSSPQDIFWDQQAGTLDAEALRGVDAVIHLAGESIFARWSDAKKKRIIDSRVASTRLVARTIAAMAPRPRVLICASAIGFYGDRGDEVLDEDSPSGTAGEGFLNEVCLAWEAAADPARAAGIRVVHLRLGMVLSREGGALSMMLPAFRLGVGGVVGSGDQWVSWIHIDDLVAAALYCLSDERLAGPVNTVAPNPVTNRQMTKLLGHALHRPTLAPAPAFALRFTLGDMADEVALASARVLPKKLMEHAFAFRFPTMEAALGHLLGKGADR